MISRQETDSSAHRGKRRKEHHVSLNSASIRTAQKLFTFFSLSFFRKQHKTRKLYWYHQWIFYKYADGKKGKQSETKGQIESTTWGCWVHIHSSINPVKVSSLNIERKKDYFTPLIPFSVNTLTCKNSRKQTNKQKRHYSNSAYFLSHSPPSFSLFHSFIRNIPGLLSPADWKRW